MAQHHIYEPGAIYFITCNTANRRTFFREEIFCELFMESLKLCKSVKDFELYAFCLNYDHFHMLVKPVGEENISEIMRSLKTNFSRNANRIICDNFRPPVRPNPLSCNGGLQTAATENMDKFIHKYHKKFHTKYPHYTGPKFSWQKGYHDQIIRGENDFLTRFHYCQNNYLKHDLPETWEWTSQNFENLLDPP